MQNKELPPGKLVAATHNPGKLIELSALLSPLGFEILSAHALGLAEPEETAPDFAGNAALKALASAKGADLPALADDSGLAVNALNGDPGIYSARWAGPDKDFGLAMDKIEQLLQEKGATDFSARFICALALAWPDGQVEVFEGEVRGQLCFPPRGDRGFGYDPIFIAEGYDISFGEMEPDEKHAISHRADAFAKFKTALL